MNWNELMKSSIRAKLSAMLEPGQYVHSVLRADHPGGFQPGEEVLPASQIPGFQVWRKSLGYSPDHVYLWNTDMLHNNPTGDYEPHTSDPGFDHYLVQPLGEVERDPEGELLDQANREQGPGAQLPVRDWWHDYWYRTPKARVIRQLTDNELY
jgi:hypothetical protein